MDDFTLRPGTAEGLVKTSGGTTPGSFPHRCPYRPDGATQEFCEDTTTNLQRNKAGCCGTQDNRNIAPCNSMLRRCVMCLVRGEGRLKRPVVDLVRGLCEEHMTEVDRQAKEPPKPPVQVRSIYFASAQVKPRERPAWTKPVVPIQPRELERIVRTPIPKPAAAAVKQTPMHKPTPSPVPSQPKAKDEILTPPPVSGALVTDQEFEVAESRISSLSKRERQVALALLDNSYDEVANKLALTTNTAFTYMHVVAKRLGLRTGDKFHPYDRLGALRLVVDKFKDQFGAPAGPRKSPTIKVEKLAENFSSQENELLLRFRTLSESGRGHILALVRILK